MAFHQEPTRIRARHLDANNYRVIPGVSVVAEWSVGEIKASTAKEAAPVLRFSRTYSNALAAGTHIESPLFAEWQLDMAIQEDIELNEGVDCGEELHDYLYSDEYLAQVDELERLQLHDEEASQLRHAAEERLLHSDRQKIEITRTLSHAALAQVVQVIENESNDQQISRVDIDLGQCRLPVLKVPRLAHIALSARLLPRPFLTRRCAG